MRRKVSPSHSSCHLQCYGWSPNLLVDWPGDLALVVSLDAHFCLSILWNYKSNLYSVGIKQLLGSRPGPNLLVGQPANLDSYGWMREQAVDCWRYIGNLVELRRPWSLHTRSIKLMVFTPFSSLKRMLMVILKKLANFYKKVWDLAIYNNSPRKEIHTFKPYFYLSLCSSCLRPPSSSTPIALLSNCCCCTPLSAR